LSKKGLSRRDSLVGALAERETRCLVFAGDFFAAVFFDKILFAPLLFFGADFFLASFFPAPFFAAVRFLPEVAFVFVSFFLAFFLAIAGSLPPLHMLTKRWRNEFRLDHSA
jgi:hypothetical protein